VPSSVREIVVRSPKAFVTVTDPANVARIVRWFDALPITPPGVVLSCPLTLAATIKLAFRTATGVRVATAAVPATRAWVCDTIGFTIHGRRQTPLIDPLWGHSFVDRVQRLLGVRFSNRRPR
jgi:hypothetical protein